MSDTESETSIGIKRRALGDTNTAHDVRGKVALSKRSRNDEDLPVWGEFSSVLTAAGLAWNSRSSSTSAAHSINTSAVSLVGFTFAANPGSLTQKLTAALEFDAKAREAFVKGFQDFLTSEPVNLQRALLPLCESRVSSGGNSSADYYAVRDSLIKVLLKCDCIQSAVIEQLLTQLHSLATSTASDVPRQILSQMRWLDHLVDAKGLTDLLLKLLEALPLSHKADLIGYLPEVVEDSELDQVVDKLQELQNMEPDLLVNILDAYSSLPLPPRTQESIVENALELIPSVDFSTMPILVRFLLESATAGNMVHVIKELRKELKLSRSDDVGGAIGAMDMDPDRDSCESVVAIARRPDTVSQLYEVKSSGDALILEALTRGMQFRPDVAAAFITAIQKAEKASEHFVTDIWIMFCLHSISEHKNKAATLLHRKVAARQYTVPMLEDAVNDRGDALSGLFTSMLSLADTLIRSIDTVAQMFGVELYTLVFKENKVAYNQSEVALAVMAHAGAGAGHEIDCALAVLTALSEAENTTSETDSNAHTLTATKSSMLKPYASLVIGLLDYLSAFTDSQIRSVFTLMCRASVTTTVRTDTRTNNKDTVKMSSGIDDLHIFVRKQLSSVQMSTKRVGIIGAVVYAAHLKEVGDISSASMYARGGPAALSASVGYDSQGPLSAPLEALNMIMNSCANNTEATSFMYGELAKAVASGKMDKELTAWIGDACNDPLGNTFVSDGVFADSDSKEPDSSKKLKTLHCLGNVRTKPNYNLDGQEAQVALDLVKLLDSEKVAEREAVLYLCDVLGLAAACAHCLNQYHYQNTSEEDSDINGLLGCPILLPDAKTVDVFASLSTRHQKVVFDSHYYSAQWLRSLISAFVVNADTEFRGKIVKRLEHLQEIESNLVYMLKRDPKMEVRGQVLLEMKHSSSSSSTAASDKPRAAKAGKGAGTKGKGKAKAAAAATDDAIITGNTKGAVVDAVNSQDEDVMRKKLRDSMQPLSQQAVLCLGFPEMDRKRNNSNSSTPVSMEAVRMLLEELVYHLNNSLPPPKKLSVFGMIGNSSSSSSGSSSSSSGDSYSSRGKSKYDAVDSACVMDGARLVHMYLQGGVFSAINTHFNAMARGLGVPNNANDHNSNGGADNRYTNRRTNHRSNSHSNAVNSSRRHLGHTDNPDEPLEDKEILLPCFKLLLQIVKTVCTSSELQLSESSQLHLRTVLGDICGGELTHEEDAFELMFTALASFAEPAKVISDVALAVELVQVLEVIATCRVRVLASSLEGSTEPLPEDAHAYKLHHRLSKVCYKLLKRDWTEHDNKLKYNGTNLGLLVRLHLKWASNPLKAIRHLASDILPMLLETDESLGPCPGYPTLSANSFIHWYKPLFLALVEEWKVTNFKGYNSKDDLRSYVSGAALIHRATEMVYQFGILMAFTKGNATLEKKTILLAALQIGHKFALGFLKTMPFFDSAFRAHQNKVVAALSGIQKSTRQLQSLCLYAKLNKEALMLREAPAARRTLEQILYKVKSLTESHGIAKACQVKKLKNRNIDGTEVQDEYHEEEGSEHEEQQSEQEMEMNVDNNEEDPGDETEEE